MNTLRAFWASTVGKKIVMAVTGIIGIGFVIGHMLGNLQVFLGPAKFNAYAEFLKSLGGLLWVARVTLLAAVVLHVVAAVQLSRRRLIARPVPYKGGSQNEVSTFASRTIRWGGALLFAFIVFHILHFTTRSIFPSYSPSDVYDNVLRGFGVWWIVLLYVASMMALGLHLYHGVWSSLRTLGAAKSSGDPLRRPAALIIAIVIWLGFTAVPIAVFGGWVGRPTTPAVPSTTSVGRPSEGGQ